MKEDSVCRMNSYIIDSLQIGFALFLVLLNGFFVAAEFALVKVRPMKIARFVEEGRVFAKTAQWLLNRSFSGAQFH